MQLSTPQPYSLAFNHSIAFVLEHEGGRVNHPSDPGGDTFMGISRRAYPKEDFDTLTTERATFLYHRDYWRAANCPNWAASTAQCVFDAAVQHGPVTAIKLLQEVAGVKSDGIVGPNTTRAVNAADTEWLIARYVLRRARLYSRIQKKNPSQSVFIEGWFNRLRDLTDSAWEITTQEWRYA